jgi:hypothetical protein
MRYLSAPETCMITNLVLFRYYMLKVALSH